MKTRFYYYTSIFQFNSICSEDSHGGRQHIDGGWMPSPFITLLLVHQTILFNVPNPFVRVGAVHLPLACLAICSFQFQSFQRHRQVQETDHGHNSQAVVRLLEKMGQYDFLEILSSSFKLISAIFQP